MLAPSAPSLGRAVQRVYLAQNSKSRTRIDNIELKRPQAIYSISKLFRFGPVIPAENNK